jgi:hypothetical protein
MPVRLSIFGKPRRRCLRFNCRLIIVLDVSGRAERPGTASEKIDITTRP